MINWFVELYNHFFINNSLLLEKYFYVLILSKGVKKELFSFLADWIIDSEPDYPSFADCKLWIKKHNSKYIITKEDEKEILMLLTYLPMSQQMNNDLYAKYLEQILNK